MLRERSELENNLIDVLETQVKPKRKLVSQIKEELKEYGILAGDAQGYIGSASEELPKLNPKLLFLLTESVYKATGTHKIFPKDYFTEAEIKESYQYDESINRENFNFPKTIPFARILNSRKYQVILSAKEIKELLDHGLLYYNFETQREASFSRKNDKIIIEPTINKQNIKEMTEHILNSTLESTELVFNAAPRTALSGSELLYDSKKLELTITEGSRLDIIDGYHRCLSIQNALEINPDIDLMFPVQITNYPTKKAQQFLAQIAKATPISKTRAIELEQNRLSDQVVQQLRDDSDLKISQTHRIHSLNDELVSYNVLSDAIDEEFSDMKTNVDALDVGEFLTDYFNYIVGTYREEFIENVNESRKTSIINSNNMFIGYIILAKRMFDQDIKVKEVRKIFKKIDFSRNNQLWVELDILDSEGNFNTNTNKVRKSIRKYFNEIELSNN